MTGRPNPPMRTMGEFTHWLKAAPEGTQIPAQALAEIFARLEDSESSDTDQDREAPWSWPDLLWVVPAERRLGVKEVCEALGKSRAWLYSRMDEKQGRSRIPHRKLDGQVVFTAGELRAWIRDQEIEVCGGRMDSTPQERGLRVVGGVR